MVKRLPTMQESQVRSLGGEDPLDKEMAIHSSILAWKIPWTEEPGGLQSMRSQKWDITEPLYFINTLYVEKILKENQQKFITQIQKYL